MMITVPVTAAERTGKYLDTDKCDLAISALRRDGCVVLQDAVDVAHITALRDHLLADLPRVLARKSAPFNFNTNNVQQSPSRDRAMLFADVVLNEQVIAITSRMLLRVHNTLYSGNTALPGEQRQPVHCDRGHLWNLPDTPPHCMIINVVLVDTSVDNGSTELWPGTHSIPAVLDGDTVDVKIPSPLLAARRQTCPPIQPFLRAGSIVVRDNRLWHAGMPNRTPNPRPMITIVHTAGWLPAWERTQLQADTRDFFNHPLLRFDADFVDAHLDHTQLDQPYGLDVELVKNERLDSSGSD